MLNIAAIDSGVASTLTEVYDVQSNAKSLPLPYWRECPGRLAADDAVTTALETGFNDGGYFPQKLSRGAMGDGAKVSVNQGRWENLD